MGARCKPLHGVTRPPTRSSAPTTSGTRSASPSARPTRRARRRAYASLVGPIAGARRARRRSPAGRVRAARCRASTLQRRPRPLEPDAVVVQPTSGRGATCKAAPARRSAARPATHEVGAADLGHTLVAIVQARSGATTQAVFSAATAPAAAAPAPAGPASSAPPLVGDGRPAGRKLTGAAGTWSGSGAVTLRLPVVPLRRRRRALQVDPRRDRRDLHAGREGRRPDARLHGARDRRGRHDDRLREPRRSGRAARRRRSSRPRSRRSPAPDAGPDAAGLDRQLDADAVVVRLPVAALQPERPALRADRGRDRELRTPSTADDVGHALLARRPRDGGSRAAGRAQRRDRARSRSLAGPANTAPPW